MAMTVVWDLIDGADVSLDTSTLEITRSGMVTGIATTAAADPFATVRAVVAALATSPFSAPGTIGTWMSRVLIKPMQATDRAKLLVTYKGPSPAQKSGVAWLVEDHSTLGQEREEVDWKTGKVLAAAYQGPTLDNTAAAAASPTNSVPSQINPRPLAYPTPMTPMRPRRVITANGYTFGQVSNKVLDCLDCVNAKPWPTTSLFAGQRPFDPGFWLCTASSAELQGKGLYGANPTNPKQMMFKASISFTTKSSATFKRDWSQYGIYKNIKGFVPPDLLEDAEATKRLKLMNSEYKEGAITGGPGVDGAGKMNLNNGACNGFIKYGGYPMKDWTGIFGL